MIVDIGSVDSVLSRLENHPILSVDTETTGLFLWKDDRLFSVAIGSEEGPFYFNFWGEPAHDETVPPPEYVLPKKETLSKIAALFTEEKTLYMHNAKFDIGMLEKEGVKIYSKIHDTEVGARLLKNDHISYELSEVAKRAGFEKSDAVEEYISKHKVWEWKSVPGKKTRTKNKFFHKVPFSVMSHYASIDADITYKIGRLQEQEIKSFDEKNSINRPTLLNAFESEKSLTPVAYAMEKEGLFIDVKYCREAIQYEDERTAKCVQEFKKLTGFDFVDSGKSLATVFSAMGFPVPQTAKGNPSFTDDILQELKNPVAEIVREYRDASKRANTYFRSFLFHADDRGLIHTNLKQAGTKTGRFSCATPNLQNLSKDEEEGLKYPVRRAFIPEENFYLVMIDYNQMEFRMMLDYAGQHDLIEKIMNGHDPHDATAELTSLSRKSAKTLNFGLLYGMGVEKLAGALNVSLAEAKKFKYKYFSNLPEVERFLFSVSRMAKQRGFVRSWDGRLYHFKDPDFSYKAPNAVIQGGCASVVKRAMPRIEKVLLGKKSKMLMQIHDELLFKIHKDETDIVEKLKETMETVYPYKHLPLTCSVSYSLKSWGDPVEGLPQDATRDQIQEQSTGRVDFVTVKDQKTMVRQNPTTVH